MIRRFALLAVVSSAASFLLPAERALSADPSPVVVNRVRYMPAAGHEQAMVGGRITGSNESATAGFSLLGEIKEASKPGQWSELPLTSTKPYRWVRYEAPAGTQVDVAELEFYAGDKKLVAAGFGSKGQRDLDHHWRAAMDGKTETFFSCKDSTGRYVGIDLQDQATARKPFLIPGPRDYKDPQKVTLKSSPDAVIRYTIDGTTPTEKTGLVYSAPIQIDRTSTVVAVAFAKGLAASPTNFGTYIIGPPPVKPLASLHLGNSLTGNAGRFPVFALTAGLRHEYHAFLIGGSSVDRLWKGAQGTEHQRWLDVWNKVHKIDLFTMQPREFDVPKEADAALKFLKVVREKSPDVQPWMWAEWTEQPRQRPTDKGLVPSSQMKKLYPALTWEESMGAMLLYVEELQREIAKTDSGAKPVRVIPVCLAMGWINNMINHGQVPGASPDSMYPLLFEDHVHVNPAGSYLVDLVWYSAFYRRSPENVVLPVTTDLSADQARVLQRLAWDTVKNYPDCDLYEVGTEPAGTPTVTPSPGELSGVTPITLGSATPGAWFRYTLDGTAPTRTRGYVYCGVISMRPGMTLKAVAYKSGMAESPVLEAKFPSKAK
jgi:hypothetical protein